MTKKSRILVLILPVFFNNSILGMKSSPYVITFFLKPQTEDATQENDSTNIKNMKNPVGKAIKSIINKAIIQIPKLEFMLLIMEMSQFLI